MIFKSYVKDIRLWASSHFKKHIASSCASSKAVEIDSVEIIQGWVADRHLGANLKTMGFLFGENSTGRAWRNLMTP